MTERPLLSLEYLYHPPAQSEANGAFFLLHGYGSNEEDLFSFVGDLPKDYHYFSLRAPFGLDPFGYAWYAIDFDAPEGKWSNTEQAVESRGAILQFIDEACDAFGIDQNNLNLLGFSQGCILSFALALSFPERFKRVVGLSGHICFTYTLGPTGRGPPLPIDKQVLRVKPEVSKDSQSVFSIRSARAASIFGAASIRDFV